MAAAAWSRRPALATTPRRSPSPAAWSSTTTNWFDDLGNLKQTQDPLTHNTFIDYTDSWGTQSGASACAPSGGSAQAFVTKITNHLGQIARSSYYSCSSRGATTTDLNSQTTTFSYDLMDRRTQVNLPDGGQTSVCYSEIQGSSCYSAPPPLKVVTTTKVDSTKNLVAAAVYDGLGRVSQAQLNSDPQGITYTDTTYDNLGRKATVSNPYRSTGDPTYGITTYQYDALGRTTKVIPPDGTGNNNYVLTEYCGNA